MIGENSLTFVDLSPLERQSLLDHWLSMRRQLAMGQNSTIMTVSGLYFDYINPTPEMVSVLDIAHHLSHICRFTGATRQLYTVAQHAVLVSYLVPRKFAYQGLHHDDTEAYVGDMNRPLKMLCPEYRRIEARVWSVIAKKLGLPEELDPCVKEADNRMLVTEKRDLLPQTSLTWEWAKDISAAAARIVPWPPELARQRYLERHDELVLQSTS